MSGRVLDVPPAPGLRPPSSPKAVLPPPARLPQVGDCRKSNSSGHLGTKLSASRSFWGLAVSMDRGMCQREPAGSSWKPTRWHCTRSTATPVQLLCWDVRGWRRAGRQTREGAGTAFFAGRNASRRTCMRARDLPAPRI